MNYISTLWKFKRKKRLKFYGHIIEMNNGRLTNQILNIVEFEFYNNRKILIVINIYYMMLNMVNTI